MRIVNNPPDRGPIPDNSPFIRAMIACENAFNAQHRENMYRTLLKSTLLIPVGFPPGFDDGRTSPLPEDGPNRILTRIHPETGEEILFAFIDEESMIAYKMTGFSYIDTPAQQLFERLSAPDSPSLIVCTSDSHLPVSREEILQLAQGLIPPPQLEAIPQTSSRPRRIAFKELDSPLPDSVRKQMQSTLEKYTDIKAVYVFMVREDDQDPANAAGVIFSPLPNEASARPMLDEIAALLKSQFPPDDPLTVFPLPEEDPFAKDIVKRLSAFYQRRLH